MIFPLSREEVTPFPLHGMADLAPEASSCFDIQWQEEEMGREKAVRAAGAQDHLRQDCALSLKSLFPSPRGRCGTREYTQFSSDSSLGLSHPSQWLPKRSPQNHVPPCSGSLTLRVSRTPHPPQGLTSHLCPWCSLPARPHVPARPHASARPLMGCAVPGLCPSGVLLSRP